MSACEVAASFVLHKGTLRGKVAVGGAGRCRVDWARRAQIMPNHTMTHVLNHALRARLGNHVDQKGSVVLPDKLTFDFSNNGPVSVEQLAAVQRECQASVAAGQQVYSQVVPLAQAKQICGLRAVFGEVRPAPALACMPCTHRAALLGSLPAGVAGMAVRGAPARARMRALHQVQEAPRAGRLARALWLIAREHA